MVQRNYNTEIIDTGNYWTIKNLSEEAALDIAGIIRLSKAQR